MIKQQNISIADACTLISTFRNPFSPVIEALMNSFDAISQRLETNANFTPEVVLSMNYQQSKDLFDSKEQPSLASINIEDNGIGFNSDNYDRFQNFADISKNKNNKGTGKVQYFCRFNHLSVKSTFVEGSVVQERSIEWKRNGDYTENTCQSNNSIRTKVTLSEPNFTRGDDEFYKRFCIKDSCFFEQEIYNSLLIRLWLGSQENGLRLIIRSYINEELIYEHIFDKSSILPPEKRIEFSINQYRAIFDENHKLIFSPESSYRLHEVLFKIDEQLVEDNGIILCSKGIEIESLKIPEIKKNEVFDGKRFLICVYGDLFDQPNCLNMSGDHFNFKTKKEVEKDLYDKELYISEISPFCFRDEIIDLINEKALEICKELIDVKKRKDDKVKELGSFFGFSSHVVSEAMKSCKLTDTEEELTEKLFSIQAKKTARLSFSLKKTYDEIRDLEGKNLNPLDEDFQSKLQDLSEKLLCEIPESNKDNLSRYIIHRDLVIKILELIVKNELNIQKTWVESTQEKKQKREPEGLLHDLILRRKTQNNTEGNELWLFSEDFIHYDSCSDLPFTEIEYHGEPLFRSKEEVEHIITELKLCTLSNNVQNRPDIFLYPEEGKCIIIEFKSCEEKVTDFLDQIPKYARIIASYSKTKITQYYGYLIGSNIDQIQFDGNWRPSVTNDCWIRTPLPINSVQEPYFSTGILYLELIEWNKIVDIAKRRNRNFAEKLGIVDSSGEI